MKFCQLEGPGKTTVGLVITNRENLEGQPLLAEER
jgi:hypothetical protein